MFNISDFAQMRSVLVQSSTAPARQVVLEKGLLSDIRAKCRYRKWTLQQDGALAHTGRN